MQQHKKKLSERAKNIIIIVLAALVVTALIIKLVSAGSGTEVTAEQVGPGTISASIRGSGTVSSNATFEVVSEAACTVFSLPVTVGDTVDAGDVLAECTNVSAEEAEKLKNEIDELMLKYKQDLIDKSEGRYASELADIEKAQKALDKAKEKCALLLVTDEDIAAARDKANSCEAAVIAQEDVIARLEALSGTSSSLTVAQAEDALKSLMLVYGEDYNVLVTLADQLMEKAGLTTAAQKDEARDQYVLLAVSEQKAYIQKLYEDNPDGISPAIQKKIDRAQASIDSYDKINPAMDAVKLAKKQAGLSEAREALVPLKQKKAEADDALSKLEEKRKEWQAENDGLSALRDAVDTATAALAAAQKEGQKEDLQLTADEQKIQSKKDELEALTNGGAPTQILCKAHGIITAISVTAGSSISAGTTIMTLEASDMGYSINIPVTAEQSSMVKPGDIGTVTIGFEPTELSAVLKEIKNDPDNPGINKLLIFDLIGESAETGMELNISVGEPDEQYDTIVPLRALREDSEGNYVLRVLPKRGLFGTRYVLERVAVEVLARDDKCAAVKGQLSSGDMAITTHPLDIKPGATIRLQG